MVRKIKRRANEKKVNNKSRPRDRESDREVGHRGQEEVLMLVLEEVKGVADRLSKMIARCKQPGQKEVRREN